MTTKYLTFDAGPAAILYGVAYHRNATNPVCHASDTSPAGGDSFDYAEQTFDEDDDFSSGGTVHRTWTACQMAVASGIHGQAVGTPSDGSWSAVVFTAPGAGVLRCFISGGTTQTIEIKVNDVEGTGPGPGFACWSSDNTVAEAVPRRLASGDEIKLRNYGGGSGSTTVTMLFCPYVYP